MSHDEILSRLSKAGALVGISNAGWWSNLVSDYGEPCVLAIVDELKADTGQVVNVTAVASRCKDEAKRKQDEADDAAEDAAMARQIARSPKVDQVAKGGAAAPVVKTVSAAAEADTQPIQHPLDAVMRRERPYPGRVIVSTPIREAAPAAVTTDDSIAHPGDGFPASTTAAGDAPTPTPEAKRAAIKAPWGLTEQEKTMATIKQLLKSVEDEIKRRGITAKAAQEEIGVAGTAIYAWRKGDMSEKAQEKITTWLLTSAKAPDASDETDEAAPLVKVKVKRGDKIIREHRRTPPASEREATSGGDLIARGEQLVQKLTEFGCEQHAATVSELVEKWRTVRSALSA